ncbi:MAG: helix-turn-helix transcriptional regulator [Myxococcales bacterium]|nr:MAG: helix-turn-helix transcriptional regulator [Myxococcales bacterium]
MLPRVLLATDRSSFEQAWRAAGAECSFEIETCKPAQLAEHLADADGLVIDGDSSFYDEDELLVAVGLAKSKGLLVAVMVSLNQKLGGEPDLLNEMCEGLVVNYTHPVSEMAFRVERRIDKDRERRFEYLTVCPNGKDLLAIDGQARAWVLSRPLSAEDDESEVQAITLSDDARFAVLSFNNGKTLELIAEHIFKSKNAQSTPQSIDDDPSFALNNAELGPRLKALRLQKGLTQAEVARRSGIHRPNIARVEAGRHTPSLETLRRLADAIGVSTAEILAQVNS